MIMGNIIQVKQTLEYIKYIRKPFLTVCVCARMFAHVRL